MLFVPHVPAAPLDSLVETLIYFRDYCPEHSIERIVPDGSINLVIELDGQPRHIVDNETLEPITTQEVAWLSGIHVNFFSITAVQKSEMFVVRFRPGGAFPFTSRPLGDLADLVQPAEQWFGDSVLELRKLLLDTPEPEDKLAVTESWLGERYRTDLLPPKGIANALQRIQAEPTISRLNELTGSSGYSQKQFIHLFRKHVGVSPKIFQRILRFSQVLPQLQQEEKVNWAQLGADCGYYDQAHFIRDFKAFSGYNPQDYFDEKHERLNFFPVD